MSRPVEAIGGVAGDADPADLRPSRGIGRLRGSLAGGIVVVGSATALGQLALLVVAPILARLYDPAAFGLLAAYIGVLSVLSSIAALRYDLAVPLADDAHEAIELVVLSLGLGLAAAIVVGLACLVVGSAASAALGVPELAGWLWLLPIALFAAAVGQALGSWAVQTREFGALGRLRAVQAVGQAAGQLVLGLLGAGIAGLLAGDLLGRIVGIRGLALRFAAALRGRAVSRTGIVVAARRRWPFARVMTAAALLNALSLQAPFLLIPSLFDLAQSGHFFLAYRVLVLPAAFVAAAVSQVFFGEAAARRAAGGGLHDLARAVTVALFTFVIPAYGAVALAGQAMWITVFGEQWADSGTIAQILAPAILLWGVANPISSLLLVGERQRESLGFTLAELLLKVASLVVGGLAHSLILGVAALTVTSVVLEIAALWRFLRVASVQLRELARPVAGIALASAPLLVVLALIHGWPGPVIVVVALGGALLTMAAVAFRSPEVRSLIVAADA